MRQANKSCYGCRSCLNNYLYSLSLRIIYGNVDPLQQAFNMVIFSAQLTLKTLRLARTEMMPLHYNIKYVE